MKIIANQSILHNNVTNCTFIASELDEEVQTGTRENDSHIEWMGNLNLPAPSQSRIAELEAENAKLGGALGLHDTWPVTDVLNKLCEAAEYLLDVKNYDRHGWKSKLHPDLKEIIKNEFPQLMVTFKKYANG